MSRALSGVPPNPGAARIDCNVADAHDSNCRLYWDSSPLITGIECAEKRISRVGSRVSTCFLKGASSRSSQANAVRFERAFKNLRPLLESLKNRFSITFAALKCGKRGRREDKSAFNSVGFELVKSVVERWRKEKVPLINTKLLITAFCRCFQVSAKIPTFFWKRTDSIKTPVTAEDSFLPGRRDISRGENIIQKRFDVFYLFRTAIGSEKNSLKHNFSVRTTVTYSGIARLGYSL